MSRARDIYVLIQEVRNDMKDRWAGFSVEQFPLKVERDKQCEELQAKIAETFPDEFPHLRKEPEDG